MRVTGRLIDLISPGRLIAFEVLQEVETGAYASDTLRERSARLERRDAALAGQIVFGTLRFQGQLDYLIEHYSGRQAESLDTAVKLALRNGIFQLRYLDRIPVHAAVHETVELVKHHRRAASGLTNAVLRKVNRGPVKWPNEAIGLSCPAWLLERWSRHFGREQAIGIAKAALDEPIPYIRVPPGSAPPGGAELEPTSIEGCYRLLSPPTANLRLHDISSQAIVPLLGLEPGQSYLDLCAAPGNKTRQALETPLALAVACDISPARITSIPSICPRVVLDGTETLPFRGKFDRIFIDAPCSGTGTIRRNPEIKWRVQEPDLASFQERQVELVSRALPLLEPEGRLLYATCSLEREENEDTVSRVLATHPEIHCTQQLWRVPGRDEGDGFYAAVLSSEAG